MLDPTQNRGVRQRDASVRHHDDQISQAQFEARVSADTQDDDLSVEMPPLEQMLRLEQTAAFCHRRSITTGLHQNRFVYLHHRSPVPIREKECPSRCLAKDVLSRDAEILCGSEQMRVIGINHA